MESRLYQKSINQVFNKKHNYHRKTEFIADKPGLWKKLTLSVDKPSFSSINLVLVEQKPGLSNMESRLYQKSINLVFGR